MIFSLGTYLQVSINNPTSSVRRGVVDPGPQYFLPAESDTRALIFFHTLGQFVI